MPNFSKEQSKKIQVGSEEGIITILKPCLLKTHCSETQVDPILAHSGYRQIGKKDTVLKTKRGIAPLKFAIISIGSTPQL
jgi:hypothetical protein